MTDRIKGRVTKCGKGKFSYFIMLDGSEIYYNTKFEPKCGPGDIVGLEYERKGENRANIRNVKIFEDNGGASKNDFSGGGGGSSSSGGGGWSGGGKRSSNSGESNTDRQDSIVWQHSQEMALTMTSLMIASEAFVLKGKPNDKAEQIGAFTDMLTVKYFKDAMNPRKSEAWKSESESESDSKDTDAAGNEWEDEGESKKEDGQWDDWD